MSDPDRTNAPLLITGAVRRPVELIQRRGPLASLLTLVQPLEGAERATVRARDGMVAVSVPLEWLRRGRLDGGHLEIPGCPEPSWQVADVVSIELTGGVPPGGGSTGGG